MLDQNSVEPAYSDLSGFFMCMIDSYRLALGDFEVVGNFFGDEGNNSEFKVIFWFIFFVGTLVSLLIILNMVIAVMGATFERVDSDTEAHIYRTRLTSIVHNFYMFPQGLKDSLVRDKYLIAIEVDPDVDPIEKESMEKRINARISGINADLTGMNEELVKMQTHQDSLFDKFGFAAPVSQRATEKKAAKKNKQDSEESEDSN